MRKHRNPLLHSDGDIDPMSTVANLFDAAMVFAVALMVALVARFNMSEIFTKEDFTMVKNPGKADMEIITREAGAAILQYGFEKLGFIAIGADAAVSNTVSDKILRNFSFIPVAEVQKQRYYILHGTDWDRCPAHEAQSRRE